MAKAKKSKAAKRPVRPAKRTKTKAKKAPARAVRKRAAKPRKVQSRAAKRTVAKPTRARVASFAKKSAKPVRAAQKKTVAKKTAAPKLRTITGSKIASPKVIRAKKSIAKTIAAPVAKTSVIATRPIKATKPIKQNLMPNNTKNNIKEVAPGGGVVQPATRSAPEMRLRADDAEILASAKERYGRRDLDAFRKLIREQVQEAREEFEILSQNILDTSGEFEADNQAYSLHTAEQGTDAIEREKTFLHAQRTSDYIKKLDEALERIERGTYGICIICGELIEKERLQAVPITQKHVDCKNKTQPRKPGSGNSGFRDEEPPPNVE